MYAEKGTVAFGAGLQGWAFTLNQFASRYAKKFGVKKEQLMPKLWGDNFFNPKTKKWTTKHVADDGTELSVHRSVATISVTRCPFTDDSSHGLRFSANERSTCFVSTRSTRSALL